jgi:hypothetical protein
VELALNLVCLLITCGSVLAWTLWRRRSDSTLVPELGRGLFVVGCILMLVLPAISITDDLAQAPVLAEGVKLQDVLKAPEHIIQFVVAATLVLSLFSLGRVVLWREAQSSQGLLERLSWWSPNIEKRPPPYLAA